MFGYFKNLFFVVAVLISAAPSLASFTPGGYDHASGVAYFLEKDFGTNDRQPKIVRVDFINKTRVVIKEDGYYNSLSLNPEKNIISFFDKEHKRLIFMDLIGRGELLSIPAKVWGVVYWGDNGKFATYYDHGSGDVIVVDTMALSYERYSAKDMDPFFWAIEWNLTCGCFYYQIEITASNKDAVSNFNANVYKINDGKFEIVPNVQSLSITSNGVYYYKAASVAEMGNQLTIYTQNNEIIGEYESVTPLDYRTLFMWTENRLRVLEASGEFDLKTGRLNELLARDWFWEVGVKPGAPKQKYWDLAADLTGYVLMLNNKTGDYEVENVRSGTIVKTYKRFW